MTDERVQPGARRVSWSVWGFTAALIAAAVAIWFGVADHSSVPMARSTLPWLLVAAGFAASDQMVIKFEFREESHSVSLGDIPLLLGLVFIHPDRLMIAVILGYLVAMSLHGRQEPVKAVFNIAVPALTAVVALICYHGVLGHSRPHTIRGWVAILVATATVHLVSFACVLVVMTLRKRGREEGEFIPLIVTTALVTASNAALGIVAILVISANVWGVLLIIGIGILFGIGMREHTTLRRRHRELYQLYGFSQALAELVEADDVVAKVLTEAKQLLHCEIVELSMPIPRGVLCHSLDADGAVIQTLQSGPDTLQTLVDRLNKGILVSQDRHHAGLSPTVAARGFRDAMVAPVPGEDGSGGLLLVANRIGDKTTFEPDDLALLETLAAHSGVVLRSSELLDRLRKEAADRQHQALHDSLTGLANRTLFSTRLDAALAARTGQDVVEIGRAHV